MLSIAAGAYPRMVWRSREKLLWNPIQKKPLKNQPEERVRLRIIEFLMRSGWSKNRLSTEEAIGKITDKNRRCDIIGYDQSFTPKLLVECKSPKIKISEQTAEQVARYNQKVEAPYLLMSNGVNDFWYARDDERMESLDVAPDIISTKISPPEYYFEYWKERGFVGKKAVPALRKWFKKMMPQLWRPEQDHTIQFMDFGSGPADVPISHYYRIFGMDDGRLAITTLDTAFGGNRLVGIWNEGNENKAVLEINLDLLFDEKKGNSSMYSKAGIRTFDLQNYYELQNCNHPEELRDEVWQLFKDHVD